MKGPIFLLMRNRFWTGDPGKKGFSFMESLTTNQAKKLGRITGILYLIIIVCGMFAEGAARSQLVVVGDWKQTAAQVAAEPMLFRASLMADVIMIICDVLVGLAFYVLLKSTHQALSLLAAFFRLAQATALGLNLILLWMALQLITGQIVAVGDDSVLRSFLGYLLIDGHAMGYKLALIFFACSLIVQAYLFFKSDYFPGWLGILMLIAAAGYLIDTFATILMPRYLEFAGIFEGIVIASALTGELTLCIWLLVKGVRTKA
jgi:hypothetical protein